jgi:hypothetical protein
MAAVRAALRIVLANAAPLGRPGLAHEWPINTTYCAAATCEKTLLFHAKAGWVGQMPNGV